MKKNTGFTLIELLAVIVILAVIALIVTPIVTNVITKAKDSSYDRSIDGFKKALEFTIAHKEFKDNNDIPAAGTYTIDQFKSLYGEVEYKGSAVTDCLITIDDKNQVSLKDCKVNGSYKSDYVATEPEQPRFDPPVMDATITQITAGVTNDYKITTTVTSEDTNITYKYYYKKTSADDYQQVTTCSTNECSLNGLDSYYSYNVKVEVSDSQGNVATKLLTTGPSCFVAGTKVLTDKGLVNIEDIKVGDKVYTLNLDNNERELQEVQNTLINYSYELYEINVNGKIIKATPKHKFYVVDKGWVQAAELKKGDVLDGKDTKLTISDIQYKTFEQPIKVYNLTVNNNHNYLITESEILVHNRPSAA